MKKILGLVAIAAMMVGMLAGPAAAHTDNDVAVFTGTAELEPGLKLPDGTQVPGEWRFIAGDPWTVVVPGSCESVNHGSCSIDVSGKIGPNAAGIGASCGMSKGTDGEGDFISVATNDVHSAENVGWETSAGGTIVITSGTIEGATIAGLVQAQGGADCAGAGATTFNVVGILAAVA